MIDALVNHLEKYAILDENEKRFIRENVPVKSLEKNQLLLSEGEVSTAFFFIISGSARLFYKTEMGEKTAFFYFENMFVSSYESFVKRTPARHSLQTMEASNVAVISSEMAMQMLTAFPKFEFLARVIMEEELIICQEIISSFVTLNAEERYLSILEKNVELLNRIPQYQLATFLGVTPETLSRIRNRIKG